MIIQFTRLFPLWAILACWEGYAFPHLFAHLQPAIPALLGVVMFGMGLTLTWENFRGVLERPRLVMLGAGLQYLVMPVLAWLIATLLDLSPMLAAGLILVGSCPGGTASNVVCYLARGDVALSITLTALSTVLAVVATPLLTWGLAGTLVPVPVVQMFQGILLMVLLPVGLGVLVNSRRHGRLQELHHLFPLISVLAIVLIIAAIVAINHDRLGEVALPLVVAVVLHNALGLTFGYLIPRWLGHDQRTCRTLAIEVGMQNSGLGVALAIKYLAPLAALPGALFSIWHNLSGSLLAGVWSAVDEIREENQGNSHH